MLRLSTLSRALPWCSFSPWIHSIQWCNQIPKSSISVPVIVLQVRSQYPKDAQTMAWEWPNSTQNVEEQNNQDKQVENNQSSLKLFPMTTVHRASRITIITIKVTQCTIATQHALCKDTTLTPTSAHKLFHAIHRRAKWLRKWEPQVCLRSHVGRGAMP